MNSISILLLFLYTTIIVSLIWARFKVFKIESNTRRLYVYLYDPAAIAQILATYYYYLSGTARISLAVGIVTATGYALSLTLFWYSIYTARRLDFAFSIKVKTLLTSGPYKIVRHPFYASYVLAWASSTVLFNSITLWITLTYLVAYYYFAAQSEEKAILTSSYSREYANYCQQVGMFFPRIFKWKR